MFNSFILSKCGSKQVPNESNNNYQKLKSAKMMEDGNTYLVSDFKTARETE